jgi:DNA gyrase subunit A
MFATTSGTVRRNKLSDFTDVRRSGIIAMKLDEGESIVDVQICTENDDILLTTAQAMCIRFAVPDVRVFQGRTSRGVRGVDLREGDRVIGMAVLRHIDITPAEARAYFRWDAEQRGEVEETEENGEAGGEEAVVPFERLTWLKTQEQFILTVTSEGLGKRASSFEYRTAGRGGKGLIAHRIDPDKSRLVASFPVKEGEELMLVTDKGQLIRMAVADIRIAGRATQGVWLIRPGEDEHVVAAERLEDVEGGSDAGGNGEE